MLIALYERAVGLYASLIGINPYHQPGVEAGKKAAAGILDLQGRVLAALRGEGGRRRHLRGAGRGGRRRRTRSRPSSTCWSDWPPTPSAG